MENIKIFITPEAHSLLTDTSADANKYKELAIKSLYSVIKSGYCPGCLPFYDDDPFGISAIWAKSAEEFSYILLHKGNNGFPGTYCFNPTRFFEQIERSLPFPLN